MTAQDAYNLGRKHCEEYDGDMRRAAYGDWDAFERVQKSGYPHWYEWGFEGIEPERVRACRYGDIPEGGRSRNWATGEYERGISCIKIIRKQGDENTSSIYDITLGMRGAEKIIIEGWYAGEYGSDGEPILHDAIRVA